MRATTSKLAVSGVATAVLALAVIAAGVVRKTRD